MSSLYLTKVVLSDFRTYGPMSTINIAPEPGLTILCGMNGLGKTAFFEAMEYVLTGDVRRLRDRVAKTSTLARELTRFGVSAGSHAVELHFNNGSKIRRSKNDRPHESELVGLLKRPDWNPEIHDLGTYLRLTHFLPQSSRQRFLEQEEGDQWQLLKGPAGVERLEKFRALLDDQKARNAFKRLIDELTKKRDDAIKALTDFQVLLVRQRDLIAIANAGYALSPQQVDTEISDITLKLNQITKTAPLILHIEGSPAEKLTQLATSIENYIADCKKRTQSLTSAEVTFAEWNQLLGRQAAMAAKMKNTGDKLQQQRLMLEKIRIDKVVKAQNEVARIEGEKNLYTIQIETLRRVIDAIQQIEPLDRQLMENYTKLTSIEEMIAKHEARRVKNVEDIRQRNNLIKLQSAWRESQRAFDNATEFLGYVTKAKHAADVVAFELVELTRKQMELQERKESAEATAKNLEPIVTTLRVRLDAEQQSTDAIAKAVAEITLLLTDHDTVCPICSHSYSEGELIVKARSSMSRLNLINASLVEELATAQGRLKEAREAQALAGHEENETKKKINELNTIIHTAKEQRNSYESNPYFIGIAYEDACKYIDAKHDELRSQGEAIASKLSEIDSEDVLNAEREEINNKLKEVYADRQAFSEKQDEIKVKLEQYRTVVENQADTINKVGNEISALENARKDALSEAEQRIDLLELARQLLIEAEQCERAVQEELTNQEAIEATLKQEDTEIATTATSIIEIWHGYGFTEEPNLTELTRRKSDLSSDQAIVDGLRERQKATVQALQLWNQNEDLGSIDNDVALKIKQAGSNDSVEAEKVYMNLRTQAEAALQHAVAASLRAKKIAEELEQKSEMFSNASLAPLTSRIAAFNDVISPFGYVYTIEAKVNPTRTKTRQAICIPNTMNGKKVEGEPQCYLSEGQSAALGLSVLLGACIEYRWSQWPALLLDDPLQNTDLIHAAAFIDVIRGVMIDQKFQVIISTHNFEEADYITRKCRLARIPVNQIELLGLGPDGVRTRERSL